jgi:hypothetical protein
LELLSTLDEGVHYRNRRLSWDDNPMLSRRRWHAEK